MYGISELPIPVLNSLGVFSATFQKQLRDSNRLSPIIILIIIIITVTLRVYKEFTVTQNRFGSALRRPVNPRILEPSGGQRGDRWIPPKSPRLHVRIVCHVLSTRVHRVPRLNGKSSRTTCVVTDNRRVLSAQKTF